LALERVIVAGHSIHGNIALEYARRYPQNVSHVVAIGSLAVGFKENLEVSRSYWESQANESRKKVLQENWNGKEEVVKRLSGSDQAIKSYILDGPRYWFDPHYDATWLWEGLVWNNPLRVHLYGVLFGQYDLAQGPRPITAPVFVAMGRYDFIVPYTPWENQGHKLPNMSLSLFESSGHTPQLEEPAEFDRRLLDWLRSR
jgi:proline iminopeptidase